MTGLLESVAATWPAVREQAEGLGWNLPVLRQVWISPADSKSLDSAASADIERKALEAAEDNRGWLRYRSAAYDGRLWSGNDTARGPLMWAEWADKNGDVSYRLTPDSRNAGGVIRYIHREGPTAADDWLTVLAQDVILRGHETGRDLQYCVYWGAPQDDLSAVRRLFTRFIRFTREAST